MFSRLFYSASIAAVLLAVSPSGRADRFGRSLDELVKIAANSPRDARAELAAFEVFAQWDDAPAKVRAALEAIAGIDGLGDRARERVRELLAKADLRAGKVSAAEESFASRGFASTWRVLGPLSKDADVPPSELADPRRDYDGVRGSVRWRDVPAEAVVSGTLRLDALFVHREEICVLAATEFDAERAGSAVLSLSAEGSMEADWNGSPATKDEAFRRIATRDRVASPVEMRGGANRLVVRVCSDETGAMALAARLTDRSPLPISERARGIDTTLEGLLARARKKNAREEDRADAALYAYLTGAVPLGSHEARDLAQAACLASNEARPCLAWNALAVDANERRRAISLSVSKEPRNADAVVAWAQLELDAGDPARAQRILDDEYPRGADGKADILRLEILASLGFPLTALAQVAEMEKRFGGSPRLFRCAARIAKSAEATADHLRFSRELEKDRFDETEPHVSLAKAAAARGDGDAFDTELRALLAIAPFDREVLFILADALRTLGRGDEALSMLERALSLDPRDGEALKRRGLLELAGGQRALGLSHLEEAMRAEPGDSSLGEYLDEVAPAPRFEAPYVVAPEELLSWRGSVDGDAQYLVDAEVIRVLRSGLVSRFRQIAVEIGSERAARDFRTHAIEFAPSSQRVKLLSARVFHVDGRVENATGRATAPISEPWYRLYYDLEAELIELPPLSPGDVVEYLYRVDDTDVPSAMAGVFGDFVLVSDSLAKRLWRYVLIAPSDMRIEIAAPTLSGVSRTVAEAGGERVEVFEAKRVDAVSAEPYSTGETAGKAYLHASTFRSFDELGRWYAGLSRDQAIPDARIREKALSLVRGRAAPLEKVAAIFDWVVTATRYVGLEFGVHGYKPYRAAQVMSRGFGDCKDKATLLVALLGASGIRAEVALVRTRTAGDIASSPASLEVFNHAVAYVPSLDLWLDGTAEHHGARELPFEDQGVIALRMADSGPILTRTPVAKAIESSLSEKLSVSVDESGRALAKATLAVRGAAFAPAYRREFQAESTRKERFAAVLAERFLGSEIESIAFEGLGGLEGEVRVAYTAKISALGKAAGDRMTVAIDRGERLSEKYALAAARHTSLVVGPARVVSREAQIDGPSGFSVARLPEASRIETEFGSLTLDAVADGRGGVRISRRFELSVHEVAPAALPRFIEFCRRVDRALAEPVVFERRP